jgi:CMP-N-acetylneuraminic acid synthetase
VGSQYRTAANANRGLTADNDAYRQTCKDDDHHQLHWLDRLRSMATLNVVRTIAIIPARGGSKGIPGKNLKLLHGKPLLGYSIDAALNAKTVHDVYVSTDAAEIADAASSLGAKIVTRPADLATDLASSESALLHALSEISQRDLAAGQPAAELLVFLQCTSPLTRALDIDAAVNCLLRENADTCVAVTPFHYFLWRESDDGCVGINHDKAIRPMRQEREPQYLETGAIYVMRIPGFRQHQHRFFGKTALYVMPPEVVQEIDDPVDLEVARVKLEFAHKH